VVPLLVWLFLAYFLLPQLLGVGLGGTTTAILVFSLWGASEMSDMVRGALLSLPRSHREAGLALGFSPYQLHRHVIIPLAQRRLLPLTVNLMSRIIKTSPLAVLVGVVELVKRSQQIVERTQQALAIYAVIFLFFFLLCYPLSLLARRLEARIGT